MTRRIALVLAYVFCTAAAAQGETTSPPRATVYFPESGSFASLKPGPAPPSFVGKAVRLDGRGRFVPLRAAQKSAAVLPTGRRPGTTLGAGDYYVLDGSESSVAVNPNDGMNVIAGYNEGWDFDPDIPLSASTNGNSYWGSRAFPLGVGVYQGTPFSPWCNAGNASGEFFATLIRHDLFPTDNSHLIISRTTNNGATFTKFFELTRDVFQDRVMVDIDRPATLGGATGANDGKLYVCYDDFGPAGSGYAGSYLRVLSSTGDSLSEIQLSGNGTPPFRGNQFQPMSGGRQNADGHLYLVSSAVSGGGATQIANFHEITGAGGGTATYLKSTLSWASAGQRLGASNRWGVNGHRIDSRGYLAIDRSTGPRSGRLYFITNRNPNPGDASQDQGDLYLSVSTSGGSSWTTGKIPTAVGRTQYFPMMDVDAQGWIHVAYYENGFGSVNNGALNAGTASVYYTVSRDGGLTWSPVVQVNDQANTLVMEDPPIELGGFGYYMIGDYMQLRATGVGAATSAYVVWTGFDRRRTDTGPGDKKERVIATVVNTPPAPGTTPRQAGLLALLLAGTGAAALFTRRRAPADERPPRDS
jgi:hypothetical protein